MITEKILFIELFQPFAQYRNPFTFYYAQSYPLPPKSTIIGMLQNAVGDWYGNTENNLEKWWNLKVSVHGGFESIFWNYQSLIKGKLNFAKNGIWINRHDKNPGGNIWLPVYGEGITSQRSPVYQQELFNGHLYIFIKGEDNLIEKIKEALEKPQKVLYLGRSEDIIFIRRIEEVKADKSINIEGDIKLTYPTYILRQDFPIRKQKYPVYSIPTKVIFENNGGQVKHKAEITKTTERKPEFKAVIYTGYDYTIVLEENESIYVELYNIENNKEFKIINSQGWL
ncbi:MAG: type I-B CRISPR-associated protein Cas5b [Candidatus Omnitrophica bacterium]|nr:type I-B CRISPR-associated protein Cas5b [Candidatus Omnitrophota bacterium]